MARSSSSRATSPERFPVDKIAPTLQSALDHWERSEAPLRELYTALNRNGTLAGSFDFDPAACFAPLPRAYQWCDGSVYLSHAELVRKARGAEMPASLYHDPLIYQGGSDVLLGPSDPIAIADEAWGIDLEAEIAVVTGDVPMGITADRASQHIRLLMLVNDVSLRLLMPAELAKGFGFFQSKPPTAFSPVAVTPDELGEAWNGGTIHLPLISRVNGIELGRPNAGVDMNFDFPTLISHAVKTRRMLAGTIVGSGTRSNRDFAPVRSSLPAGRP